MTIQQGVTLQGGKYIIIRHISSGGFGNTYEALDVNLDKRVAIKEFFVKDFCTRESDTTLVTIASTAKKPLIEHLKKKFIDEARAIAKMEHENIVKVQALFEENGTAYYVMDYIDGESLNALLKRRGSLPEKEAVAIILKVADALGYMHKQNRFHLDVKPANIMLRKDGKVILIDFGSSKQYAEVDGENTTTLAPCYTPGYAPSEQMNPKPTTFTAATDVYALGATLYKMLTGLTPPSAIDLLNKEATLSPLSDDISENVKDCVARAMIPQRKQRMQNVDEFLTILNLQSTKDIDDVNESKSPDFGIADLCSLVVIPSLIILASFGGLFTFDHWSFRELYISILLSLLFFCACFGVQYRFWIWVRHKILNQGWFNELDNNLKEDALEGVEAVIGPRIKRIKSFIILFAIIEVIVIIIFSFIASNQPKMEMSGYKSDSVKNVIPEKPTPNFVVTEKTNKQMIIDALRTAATEYRNANDETELNCAETKLKNTINYIQGNCTVNELREINQSAEYNDVWKECMQAFEKSAERLGLL